MKELKKGWIKNDEGWIRNDEGWEMNNEGCWFQAAEGFCFQMDKQMDSECKVYPILDEIGQNSRAHILKSVEIGP